VIANHGVRGVQDATPYNHYSLLATIEDAFHLGCLANSCDSADVKPMTALFETAD
jgi:phosphatidylinositol-3-phosphatase